jgi:hypothetical protein
MRVSARSYATTRQAATGARSTVFTAPDELRLLARLVVLLGLSAYPALVEIRPLGGFLGRGGGRFAHQLRAARLVFGAVKLTMGVPLTKRR